MMLTDDELRSRTSAVLDAHGGDDATRWGLRGALFDAGLAWVHFPVDFGGLGLDPQRQQAVDEVLREAGSYETGLEVNPLGIGMAAPTLVQHGSDDLKADLLRPTFTGEEIWCQLFSEPGAGSDLAGLATHAERDGDAWIVTGQKVWTTLAHKARWGMLLARTQPDEPRHAGLTFFVLDMHASGVDVRPLYQLTGDAEFNEVFLDGCRVLDAHRVGPVGGGWAVARTTLANERVALGGGVRGRSTGPIEKLLAQWRSVEHQLPPEQHVVMRDRVVGLWVRSEVLRLTNLRSTGAMRDGTPGPSASVGKLMSADLNRALGECLLDLVGAAGMLKPSGYTMQRPTISGSEAIVEPQQYFLRTRANSIEGGTSEIMRNVLGERVLGLPREPRVGPALS